MLELNSQQRKLLGIALAAMVYLTLGYTIYRRCYFKTKKINRQHADESSRQQVRKYKKAPFINSSSKECPVVVQQIIKKSLHSVKVKKEKSHLNISTPVNIPIDKPVVESKVSVSVNASPLPLIVNPPSMIKLNTHIPEKEVRIQEEGVEIQEEQIENQVDIQADILDSSANPEQQMHSKFQAFDSPDYNSYYLENPEQQFLEEILEIKDDEQETPIKQKQTVFPQKENLKKEAEFFLKRCHALLSPVIKEPLVQREDDGQKVRRQKKDEQLEMDDVSAQSNAEFIGKVELIHTPSKKKEVKAIPVAGAIAGVEVKGKLAGEAIAGVEFKLTKEEIEKKLPQKNSFDLNLKAPVILPLPDMFKPLTAKFKPLTPQEEVLKTFRSIWKYASNEQKNWMESIGIDLLNSATILKWQPQKNVNEYQLELAKEMTGTHPSLRIGQIIVKRRMRIAFSEEKIPNTARYRQVITFLDQGIYHRVGKGWFSAETPLDRILFEQDTSINCILEARRQKVILSANAILSSLKKVKWY